MESPELNDLSLLRVTVGFARTVRAFVLSNLGNNGSRLTGAELHRGEGPQTAKSWWQGFSFLTSFRNLKAQQSYFPWVRYDLRMAGSPPEQRIVAQQTSDGALYKILQQLSVVSKQAGLGDVWDLDPWKAD